MPIEERERKKAKMTLMTSNDRSGGRAGDQSFSFLHAGHFSFKSCTSFSFSCFFSAAV